MKKPPSLITYFKTLCSLLFGMEPQTPDCMWESWKLLTNGQQFTIQNLDQLYVLASSALPTTRRDMTCTVLKAT